MFSLLLAVVLVFSGIPSFAAEGDSPALGLSGTITGFAEIDGIRVDNGTALDDVLAQLPMTVAATLQPDDAEAVATPTDIPVSDWDCSNDGGYNADTDGFYTFEPTLTLPEDVTLGAGVELPYVLVTVGNPQMGIMAAAAEIEVGDALVYKNGALGKNSPPIESDVLGLTEQKAPSLAELDGSTYTWYIDNSDPSDRKLYFHSFAYSTTDKWGTSALEIQSDVTIVLRGTSSLTNRSMGAVAKRGLSLSENVNVTIESDTNGILNLTSGVSQSGNSTGLHIPSNSSLTITGGIVDAVGGTVLNGSAYGVYSEGSISLQGGMLLAKAASGSALRTASAITGVDVKGGPTGYSDTNTLAWNGVTSTYTFMNAGFPTAAKYATVTPEAPADTTAPTLETASIDGSTLTLTFSEDISQSNFDLTKLAMEDVDEELISFTVTNTAISGPTATLTLSYTASAGEFLWLLLSPGAFEDLAGNSSVAESRQLTNNTSASASATMSAATISGTVGTPLVDVQHVVITILGDSISASPYIPTNDAVFASMIQNLPSGLQVTAQNHVGDGDTSFTLSISGTPTSTSDSSLSIIIPGSILAGGQNITVTTNNDTQWDITNESGVDTHTITATAGTGGSISPSGSVSVLNGGSKTFTITASSNYNISDVKVDGVSQGAISTYTFTNVTANHTISATFTYTGGSIITDSGSSDGDSGSSGSSSTTAPAPNPWLEPNPAQTLSNSTSSKNNNIARTKSTGTYGVRKNSWNKFTEGQQYRHDTMDGNAVAVRLYINDPTAMNRDTYVTGHVSGSAVEKRKAQFEKWFTNKIQVIHMDESNPWGQKVEIAAKVDLANMDTDNLYIYSYDKKTNTYTRISKEKYWIDKNGYLHFYTELAGDIIISDGPLNKK